MLKKTNTRQRTILCNACQLLIIHKCSKSIKSVNCCCCFFTTICVAKRTPCKHRIRTTPSQQLLHQGLRHWLHIVELHC